MAACRSAVALLGAPRVGQNQDAFRRASWLPLAVYGISPPSSPMLPFHYRGQGKDPQLAIWQPRQIA
jgi:hypothetical protein